MKIIEFEGIDGSGKTTALNFFADKLKEKGFKVLLTREVGNPHVPLCLELRKLILNPETKMDGLAMELVFAAMRIENNVFYESIKDQYDFVVNDRGWFSHLSYTDHNASTDITEKLYEQFLGTYTKFPDQVIYLNVDPDVAAKRRVNRGLAVDAIEAKGNEFQKKVRDSFLKYINKYMYTIQVDKVDANGSLESVQEQLINLANQLSATYTKV